MALEPHDELGLPWERWADGRVHRLVKGVDFLQSAELVKEAAENAGRRLGKVAVGVKESRPGSVFVWIQFVDYQVMLGEPCPCGSFDLKRVSARFVECGSCGSTLLVLEPKKRADAADGIPRTGGEVLLQSMLNGAATSPGAEERVKPRDPRKDRSLLGPFKGISLFPAATTESRERFYGRATGPGNRDWLLVVDFPLEEGEWVPSQDHPGGWSHAVWAVPARPLAEVVDLDAADWDQAELQIDDPFVDDYSDRQHTPEEGPGGALELEPPDTLAQLKDVELFRYQSTPEMERYMGFGTLADGEPVLLTVRFRLKDEQWLDDPDHPGSPLHDLFCVPVAPFGRLIDLEPFRRRDPDLRAEDPEGSFPSRPAADEAALS